VPDDKMHTHKPDIASTNFTLNFKSEDHQ